MVRRTIERAMTCMIRSSLWLPVFGLLISSALFAQAPPVLYAIWGLRPTCPVKASPGAILSVSARGLGATDPLVPPGTTPKTPVPTVLTPRVTIGGRPAEVLSSELVTWAEGVYQVNFRVPLDMTDGVQPVALSIGGQNSNSLFHPFGRTFLNTQLISAAELEFWDAIGWPLEEKPVAAESIVGAHQPCGGGLANARLAGDARNPPLALAGTTVKVKDSGGVERMAQITFVSPNQVNYIVPAGTANGDAMVTIVAGDGAISTATLQVQTVAPTLFLMDHDGQPVSVGLIRIRNGVQTTEQIPFRVSNSWQDGEIAELPIDMGPETDQVFLALAGTGWRFRSSLANVKAIFADMGNVETPVEYAGPQQQYPGVDQLNVRLPRSLAGSKNYVWFVIIVDGKYTTEQMIVRFK